MLGLDDPVVRVRLLRRWGWVVAVVAVLGGVVVVDLPTHATPAYRQATLRSYLEGVARDVAPCRAGLHDALEAFVGTKTGRPRVTTATARTFTEQAITACGFTNAGVVALGSTVPPATVSSPTVVRITRQVDAWAYLDAFNLLQDVKVLLTRPASVSAHGALVRDTRRIESRASRIAQLVRTALGSSRAPLHLTPVGPILDRATIGGVR